VQTAALLAEQGLRARVVSMPSWELFTHKDDAYRERVLGPAGTPRVAVEAGATLGWERFVGERGAVVGIDRYGASGPGGEVLKHFGFTPQRVAATALRVLGQEELAVTIETTEK
jgi:transketolase